MGAVILVILAVILAFLPGDDASTAHALNRLKVATGFTLLALIFLFGFAVLVYIANGSIDLSDLLSETGESKGASMSRFQLLIFTLVIALSLFLVVVSTMKFPDTIPPEILTLLGISASTYAVSKGIQTSGNQTTSTLSTPDASLSTTSPTPSVADNGASGQTGGGTHG
jgi:amino acid transporter